MTTHDITTCLWFDKEGREAADFYVSVFPDSRVVQEHEPVVVFELDGARFMALNGGPAHAGFTETVSFVVHCDTQEEIDRYWDTLTANGGRESMCGWLQDRFGVSWQIVPRALPRLLEDPDRAPRVMEALLQMRKLVIADLEAA
jgi:predicted 3-demethylubiquinone-9 3-methyltransferase (glyoxalase superfamily)